MPTQEQVYDAAKRVHDLGERVTQKRVLADLRAHGHEGTERTIDEHLIAWKAAQNYEPRQKVVELPNPLKSNLASFIRGVWNVALAEATARLDNERAQLRAERQAAGELLDEAHIRAEAMARENEGLTTRQIAIEEEITALRKEVNHLRKTEFWDRVIREIAEILPEQEWLTTEEIVRRLPPSLVKEAIVKDKILTPGRINRQMLLRDRHGRFFEHNKDTQQYRRRPGWTGITQPLKRSQKLASGKRAV